MTEARVALRFPGSHPALAGHFPGNPIVPGALLLSEVAAAALAELRCTVQSVRRAKFRRPLLPDQPYELVLTRRDNAISFRCVGPDAAVMAEGVMHAEPVA